MAPVIGIVGGIGSGKSWVAALLAARDGYLIRADELGHEALRRPEVTAQVVERWGAGVLDAAGEVDRKRLAAIVFADPAELRALEGMTHPLIEQRIGEEIAKARRHPEVRLIVLDAAILLEAGWHAACDHVVFVDVPRAVRLQRLITRRGWTAQAAEERENAQMPLAEKRRHADAVVDNGGGLEALGPQVERLLASWGL